MATSKRFKKASEGVDVNKSYTVEEAVKLVKARATAKFDETIELSLNLGVDPKHADQMVRGVVSLPSGSGSRYSPRAPRPKKPRRRAPIWWAPKNLPPKSRPARSTSTAASPRPT
jgi:hypothetical protein